MYDLPKFNSNNFKVTAGAVLKSNIFRIVVASLVFIVVLVCYIAFSSTGYLHDQVNGFLKKMYRGVWQVQTAIEETTIKISPEEKYLSNISYEQAIIEAVKSASPSVVSIVISKNLPVYEEQLINPFGQDSPFGFLIPQQVQKGTKYREIGAGSGFIVTEDGLIVTNKHVVLDKTADYTIVTNEGKKYSATVLALDPVQDLAILKIKGEGKFSAIVIGNSDGIQIGQGAIAIGNALGEFSNTVSVGIVSGLGRTVQASGSHGFSETLQDIIQTDAAINQGNSGGPLINLKGQVIGINTAMADNAQSIGFAIPINIAKKDIDQIIKTNKIVYPFLGVRHVIIDEKVKQDHKLSVDQGALVLRGPDGEAAVTAGSAADKAGIQENDVILEVNNQKITSSNSLQKMVGKYNPGNSIILKILRQEQELNVEIVLGERN